jgi:flagellar protein FlgJ
MDAISLTPSADATAFKSIRSSLAGMGAIERLRSTNISQMEKLRVAAQEFENHLARTMLRQMRETVTEGGLLPQSSGQKMFQEMLDDQMISETSGGLGLGLSDAIVRQLAPFVSQADELNEPTAVDSPSESNPTNERSVDSGAGYGMTKVRR